MKCISENNLTEVNQQELLEISGGFRLMYPGQGLGRMILESILGAYQGGYDKAQDYCECQ